MAHYYDSIDLAWDNNGDYVVDERGDLKDTSEDTIASMLAEVKSILLSDYNDWELHPSFAANLKDYIGEPNLPATAKAIEGRIVTALSINKVVAQEDLYVRVVPVDIDILLVVMTIQATPTPTNTLGKTGTSVLAFTLDLTSGSANLVSPNAYSDKDINLVPLRV